MKGVIVMGAKKVLYTIVGRYMDGKEVVGYHLHSMETGKAGRYSKEATAFLVGNDQVMNCTGQVFKGELLLRGNGIKLNDLPVKQENGDLSRTDNIGKVRRGTSASDAMTQVKIVAVLVNGRNTWGYIVQNAGGARITVVKEELLEAAKEGKIGNARVQNYTDKSTGKTSVILKGVNCDLKDLPRFKVDMNGNPVER